MSHELPEEWRYKQQKMLDVNEALRDAVAERDGHMDRWAEEIKANRARIAELEAELEADTTITVAMMQLRDEWHARAEKAEARIAELEARLVSYPKVEITQALWKPTKCKVWREGVLVFDGVSRAAATGDDEIIVTRLDPTVRGFIGRAAGGTE